MASPASETASGRSGTAASASDTASPASASARRQQLLPIAAALVSVLLWASAFAGIRSAERDLAPGPLAFGRLTVGAIALGVFALVRREPAPSRRALARILVCGLLWFATYNVILGEAERTVDAGTASMLVNVGPILIAALAGWLLREGFPRRLWLGCLVSFAGAVVIGLATSRHGITHNWGAMLCLAAAAAYAGGVVAQKPALREASALYVTWLACTVGALACLPFAPALVHQLADARGAGGWWMVYLGLAPTAIGFATWAYALARTPAGRLGVTTYLVPPLAIGLAWAWLGEVPPALALPGGALCLLGVALSRGALPPAARGALSRVAPSRWSARGPAPGPRTRDA